MAQNEEVTFELLVYNGSNWEAQGTYGAKEQMIAVADAKSLAKVSTVKGVKVVKEFFDGRSNVSRSLTVYEHTPNAPSSKPRPAQAPRRPRPSAPTPAPTEQQPAEDEQASNVKRPTFLGTAVKILLSVVFSVAAALVVTQMTTIALQGVRTVGMIQKGDFLVIVFILVFVITALALVTRILMNLKRIAPLLPSLPSNAANLKPVKRKRDMRLTPSADEKADKDDKSDAKSQGGQAGDDVPVEEAIKKAEEEERQKAEEEARKRADEERKRAEAAAEADALTEIITIRAFSDDALEVLDGDKEKQDAHTVFGLVLFMVGAIQALRATKNLPEHIAQTVAIKALGGIGLNRERALYFLGHTDEYLMANPRYSQMFQAGRGAMSVYLTDDIGPRGALSEALDEWKKPKSAADNSSQPVTVLFTDIAGSTAMTQKLGDEGAQQVVRVHNKIVRDALQSFTGKEIKHTGDGIMASFPSAIAGVEAAIDMQKQTKAHNTKEPNLPLGLKIGLNTGDPISEDDDLFGTTVQLAARIVDKAGSGQILVSSSVHGLSQGKKMKFARFADLDMKGFDESVTVYEALWDPDAAKAKAAKDAAKPAQPEPKAEPKKPAEKPQPEKAAKPEPAPKTPAQPAPKPKAQPTTAPTTPKPAVKPVTKPVAQPPKAAPQPQPQSEPVKKDDKPEASVTEAPKPEASEPEEKGEKAKSENEQSTSKE